MTSVTLPISEEFKKEIREFSWVNWSEIARQEAMRKIIFENYLKTGTITDEEWVFCESIDWHPVDELPLKEEFIKKLESIKKEKSLQYKSVSDFFKNLK